MNPHYSKSPSPKEGFIGTVLIADDHALFRMGLVQLLQCAFRVKRFLQATAFQEVIEHLKQNDVTLLILDLRIPGLSSPKDIAQIRRLRQDALVVVLSASDHREDILEALSAGVHGYIVKSQKTDGLIDHLRYIFSGEIYVPPILSEHANRRSRPEERALTNRQRQVLEGVVAGKGNKEIAQALNLAEGTVKMHLAALFKALGATNRAHAAALGKQFVG